MCGFLCVQCMYYVLNERYYVVVAFAYIILKLSYIYDTFITIFWSLLDNKTAEGKEMQIKKDEIKQRILTVSKRLFINTGYDNTSLRMVADKCFISKSNIYRYFSSKEEIYETLVGTARLSLIDAISRFGSSDYASNYTTDKIEEVSQVLARVMSEHREGILIMLKSVGSKDQAILTEMMTRFFVEVCPIDDREFKIQIVSLLIMGLKDILIKYSEEDEMRYRLKMLISYHYLGLNGIKERLGFNYER